MFPKTRGFYFIKAFQEGKPPLPKGRWILFSLPRGEGGKTEGFDERGIKRIPGGLASPIRGGVTEGDGRVIPQIKNPGG